MRLLARGKTTAMFRLAKQWVAVGGATIFLSTSTHLAVEELGLADHWVECRELADLESLKSDIPLGVVAVTGPKIENSRVKGLSEDILEGLNQIANQNHLPFIIEADGSAQRPLKTPSEHEPVIPQFVNTVIVVVGLQVLGKPLDDNWVHRPDQFSQLTGLRKKSEIGTQSIAEMLMAKGGGLKGIPVAARKIVLLNQCDSPQLVGGAKSISSKLLADYHQVVFSSLIKGRQPGSYRQ